MRTECSCTLACATAAPARPRPGRVQGCRRVHQLHPNMGPASLTGICMDTKRSKGLHRQVSNTKEARSRGGE